MFRLFPRTRRRAAVVRPFRNRLTVERLEWRNAPSSLDVTSVPSAPTDPTDTSGTATVAQAPAPQTPIATTASTPVVTTTTTMTTTAGTTAGNTAPAPAPAPAPAGAVPAEPELTAITPNGGESYTVTGTVEDPNPVSLQVQINVDVLPQAVTATVTASGTTAPDGTPVDNWAATFALPVCTSANCSTRYCSVVAINAAGAQSSAAPFTIMQTPQVSSTLSHS